MDVAVRFLHAGDLHLGQPPGGLAEVPDALRAALVDAPRRAAEKVFDAALKHHVDFVVLAGDVIDPRLAGPPGIVFLDEQFDRLARQEIPVYWAGGPADGFEHWLDAWRTGPNVHRFPMDRVERVVFHRADEPLVEIFGTSTQHRTALPSGRIAPSVDVPYAMAVAHGEAHLEEIEHPVIHYWALGGRHGRESLSLGAAAAHYCGTPQARHPGELGPHGCTLVEIDESGRVRTTFVPTDAVRYCHQNVTIEQGTTKEQLLEILNERLGELLVDPFGPELLVYFSVVGCDALTAHLRSGKTSADLLAKLRAEYGAKRPAAWTVSLDAGGAELPEELYEEDTLLGEYLRTLRHYEENPTEQPDLDAYLAERHADGKLAALAWPRDPRQRSAVLAEAAALGVELLSPSEVRR